MMTTEQFSKVDAVTEAACLRTMGQLGPLTEGIQ